jgi:hypothetical protein
MQLTNLLSLLAFLIDSTVGLPTVQLNEPMSSELDSRNLTSRDPQAGFWQNWPDVNYGGEVGNYCRIPGGLPANWCVLTNVVSNQLTNSLSHTL